MRVLRLCSVYEAPDEVLARSAGFDAIGGMQVHTARLTTALDARGVSQVVVTAHRPGAPSVQTLSLRSRVVRVGVPIRRFRQLYGLAAPAEIARAGRVDLVHVHLGENLAIVPLARWAASRAGVPLVATLHCSLRHTLERHDTRSTLLHEVGGRWQSALLRSADAVLVLSRRAADRLVASGMPPAHVRLVPLGIGLDGRDDAPRPTAMDERPWVVYAGRLVREKGVRELVAAFARLSDPAAGLLIVGDGPDRHVLEAELRRLGVYERVRFVGAVSHAEVGHYL